MAGTLMLVNPRKRRGSGRRTAAQKRATAKLLAWNRAHRGHKATKSASRKRRRNPVAALANPRRGRARRSNPVRRSVRRRRNPIGIGGITGMFKPALIGAVGSIAVDTAFGYLPLPASLSVGKGALLSRAALAVGLGVLGRKFIGPIAGQAAEGALTVVLRDTIKVLAADAGVNLGYYSPGYVPRVAGNGVNGLARGGAGLLLSRNPGGMNGMRGYDSAAREMSVRY